MQAKEPLSCKSSITAGEGCRVTGTDTISVCTTPSAAATTSGGDDLVITGDFTYGSTNYSGVLVAGDVTEKEFEGQVSTGC
jgi:thioredoxin reductase